MTGWTFFATTPKGVEPLLTEELHSLGAKEIALGRGGVSFQGDLTTAYRACLWSRTANRVLLPLASFSAADSQALYDGARRIAWEDHLSADGTLAVDFSGTSPAIGHTRYGAQRVKDAIVDRFRDRCGRRPSVDRKCPDLRVNAYLLNDQATISLDLSGDSLHRRGYREATVLAPLKENLAAALLLKLDWPAIAASGGPFLDPLCGSGTLAIEAALIAADIAPGLLREYWGFLGWRQHDPGCWEALLAEARRRRQEGMGNTPPIVGYDRDPRAIRAALANARRIGLEQRVRLECHDLERAEPLHGRSPGLLLTNPPYGERLGEIRELEALYAQLGEKLKLDFLGWRAGVLTGNPALGKRMGLRARRINTFYNGPLECKLLQFSVGEEWFVARAASVPAVSIEGAESFANRLRKNLRTLGRWANREGIRCYRLYDADVPEYAVAVDVYERWVHVQEYAPPRSVDPGRAQERLAQAMSVIPTVLEIPAENVFLKRRQQQKGSRQYQKLADTGRFLEVREGPCRFLVNLSDYLDTGLFMDHRLTRQLIGRLARGRHFLNLFAYTGTASVYAALGGAEITTSVDLSRTYLDWARRNLTLNGITGPRHELVRADSLDWLAHSRERYDLIFLDPPTFSNSKRMQESFDIQRDHVALLRKTLERLEQGGILIFSTNYRRFELNREALAGFETEDLTRQTLPRDFQRNPRIHQCWKIRREP